MKPGDIVICVNNKSSFISAMVLTIGKEYKVIESKNIPNHISVIDNIGNISLFHKSRFSTKNRRKNIIDSLL